MNMTKRFTTELFSEVERGFLGLSLYTGFLSYKGHCGVHTGIAMIDNTRPNITSVQGVGGSQDSLFYSNMSSDLKMGRLPVARKPFSYAVCYKHTSDAWGFIQHGNAYVVADFLSDSLICRPLPEGVDKAKLLLAHLHTNIIPFIKKCKQYSV